VAGIGDQELLDDVGVVMGRLLQRVQADDAPAVAEPGIGKADDIGGAFLNLAVSRMQTSSAGLIGRCAGAAILGLRGYQNDRCNCAIAR